MENLIEPVAIGLLTEHATLPNQDQILKRFTVVYAENREQYRRWEAQGSTPASLDETEVELVDLEELVQHAHEQDSDGESPTQVSSDAVPDDASGDAEAVQEELELSQREQAGDAAEAEASDDSVEAAAEVSDDSVEAAAEVSDDSVEAAAEVSDEAVETEASEDAAESAVEAEALEEAVEATAEDDVSAAEATANISEDTPVNDEPAKPARKSRRSRKARKKKTTRG